jgi:hypothetical protein
VTRRSLPLFTLIAPIVLLGCGFKAPVPVRTPAPATPEPPISTFSAALTIPATQIAQSLNKMTQTHLVDLQDQEVKCGSSRCRLNLHATRTGPIIVSSANGFFTVQLPFAVDIDAAAPGFLSFLRAKAEGQGTANAQIRLGLDPDWRLRSDTKGEVQLDSGHVRIGPMVTNIAQLWNDNSQSLSQPLWRSIDKQIYAVNIKSRLAEFWRQAFKPLRVGKSPISWLVLSPERLEFAQPVIGNGNMTLFLGLEARAHVVIQDQEPINIPTPLPNASALTETPGAASVAVSFLLSYDRAAQLAMASLTRKPPHVAGMTLKFSQLQILPSGEDVVVSAQFCADPDWDFLGWFASCGTVYLRGTPQYDAAQQTIRVTNLHYDLGSANLMLHAVHALAGDQLARILQVGLMFDESKEIGRLKAQIVAAVAKPQGRDVSIAAQIESFAEPSFGWTSQGFVALFSAKAKLETKLSL